MAKCFKCGNDTEKDDAFCKKCGTKINIKQKSNKKKKIILIVIISLFLTIGVIVSIILLTRKEKYKLEPEEVEAYKALNAASSRRGAVSTYTYDGYTYTVKRPKIYKKEIDTLGNLMKKFGNEWFKESDFHHKTFYGTVYLGDSTIETILCTDFQCAKFIVDSDDGDYYLISCDFHSNTYKSGVLTKKDEVDVYYVND